MVRALGYSPTFLARRVAARTCHYVFNDGLLLLSLIAVVALVVFAVLPSVGLSGSGSTPATLADEAAERYMRALRDRDPAGLLASISPEIRQRLEQRFGPLTQAAASAVFREQQLRGERVVDYKLVGRYETVQGESVRFYMVLVEQDYERLEVPYTLTVGRDGKVNRVE